MDIKEYLENHDKDNKMVTELSNIKQLLISLDKKPEDRIQLRLDKSGEIPVIMFLSEKFKTRLYASLYNRSMEIESELLGTKGPY